MATTTPTQQKPIHSLILDTGPLIKNTISISTLINSAEQLLTTPAILSEIRDEATRSRVQTTLVPFLKIRTPSPSSYDAVVAFSKKTGDFPVLSKQDLGILALAYEVHCERHGGPSGLRDTPKSSTRRRPAETKSQEKEGRASQENTSGVVEATETPAEDDGWEVPSGKRATKRTAAKPLKFKYETVEEISPAGQLDPQQTEQSASGEVIEEQGGVSITKEQISEQDALQQPTEHGAPQDSSNEDQSSREIDGHDDVAEAPPVPNGDIEQPEAALTQDIADLTLTQEPTPPTTDSSDSDSDGDWITPTNLSAHQLADSAPLHSSTLTSRPQQLSTATMTTDFAMQNVLLQMNLLLLSPTLQRIKHVVTKVLRCHACFHVAHDMSLSFCPRCGQAALQKVSCSTNSRGEFRIHLARNYTYNKRGDKYSIPKPIAGTANGKWSGSGGGKGGWGRDLILAPDQKEFVKKVEEGKRGGTRDLMDEDYLPGILTGERGAGKRGVKVGAGRNVNAKKRT
ncbi:20S-pre-rRNA D-site endonuclease nob1 [Coniothyrium glycines]